MTMAVWQYDVSLLPRGGVIRHHGKVPDELPGYRAVWCPEEGLEEVYPNYWTGIEPPESLVRDLACLMPALRSWSEDAVMFGKEDGNKMEVWLGESLKFRFDMRNPDFKLLRAVVTFAQCHDLLWVSDTFGRPLLPDFEPVFQDLMTSDAYQFCLDPEAYLRSLPKKQKVKRDGKRAA